MRRRPICLLCLFFVIVLSLLYFIGTLHPSVPKGTESFAALPEAARLCQLVGSVRTCKTQGNTQSIILENAVLPATGRTSVDAEGETGTDTLTDVSIFPPERSSADNGSTAPADVSIFQPGRTSADNGSTAPADVSIFQPGRASADNGSAAPADVSIFQPGRASADNASTAPAHVSTAPPSSSYAAMDSGLPANVSTAPLTLGGVRLTLSGCPHLPVGTVLTLSGTLSAIEAPTNPGQFDQQLYYAVQGVSWSLKKPVVLRVSAPANGLLSSFFLSVRETLALLGQRLTDRIARIFPEEVAGTLAAMITGDKSLLSDEEKNLYKSGGLSHMLAISGLHISLLGMGLFRLLRKLKVPMRVAGLVAALFLVAYAVLTGASVATLRAVLMFLLYLLANATHRVYDVPTALAVTAILLLLENPLYLLYAGFQLSFVAVFALAAFPGHDRLFSGVILYLVMAPLTLWHYFTLPLYGVVVNLLLLPLLPVLLSTGILALLGSYVLEALGLFAVDSLPLGILTSPATFLLRLINKLLGLTSSLPFAVLTPGRPSLWQMALFALLLGLFLFLLSKWRHTYRKYALLFTMPLQLGVFFLRPTDWPIGLLAIAYLLVLLILKRYPTRLRLTRLSSSDRRPGGLRLAVVLALPFLVAGFLLRPPPPLTLTFLDVGQGDGIVLSLPDATILVDGGSSSVRNVGKNRVLPFLAYSGVGRLDYIAATHGDSDHISGIQEILKGVKDKTANLSVGTLLLPKLKSESEALQNLAALAREAGVRVVRLKEGDSLTVGEAVLDVLGPSPDVGYLDDNEGSLVFRLQFQQFDCLLTGDVEGEGEENLLEELRRRPVTETSLDVLKVAHHGSRYSTPQELLSLTRPKIAILSCGRNNNYGHPHTELLARLEESGTKIFRTDTQGAITVTAPQNGDTFTVETFQ